MPDVQFQDEQNLPQARQFGVQGLYGMVIKLGLAKNEKEASMVLIGIAVVAVLLAIFVPFLIGSSVKYTHPTPTQVEQALQLK